MPKVQKQELFLCPTCAKIAQFNPRLLKKFIHNSYPHEVDILEYVFWFRKNIFVLPLHLNKL